MIGPKSRSRSRSASSRTRNLIGSLNPFVFSRWSKSLPGVAILKIVSGHFFALLVCSYDDVGLLAERNGLRNEVHATDDYGAAYAYCATESIEVL